MKAMILRLGDLLVLYIFALIGRSSHQLPLGFQATLETAAPFMIGWVLTAVVLRSWSKTEQASGWKTVMKALFFTWLIGIPLGLAVRYLFFASFNTAALIFAAITMVTTLILFVIWRLIFWFAVAKRV